MWSALSSHAASPITSQFDTVANLKKERGPILSSKHTSDKNMVVSLWYICGFRTARMYDQLISLVYLFYRRLGE